MLTVLITGSEGFFGRNLKETLRQRDDIRLLVFDLQDDSCSLGHLLDQADFVYHLAGVNRPQHPDEFVQGNVGLTETICRYLSDTGKQIPLVLTSSIQAELDNPYGLSKRAAEATVFAYGEQCRAPVYVFRMPNVFGKWCRPNYNSAVATFCHNIAHDLPIQVNDPTVKMCLVYIDDVVACLVDLLAGHVVKSGAFCLVEPVHAITLGEIVELLHSFRKSRELLSIPDMSNPLTKKLYSTYLSYLPIDCFSYPLTTHTDQRGSFTEFIRTPDRGQVSVNISKPGITKGNHWHHTRNEKFLVVSGTGVIRFRQVGSGRIVEYPVSEKKLEVIDIPTGYTHAISNTGSTDLVTVMWCNEPFDPDHPDTHFENVESTDEET